MTAHIFNRSLLSAITVLQGLHECVFNIFWYFFKLLFIHLHHFSPWDLQADHTVAFGAFFCNASPLP